MSVTFWNRAGLYALSAAAACCLTAFPSFPRQSSQQQSSQQSSQQQQSKQQAGQQSSQQQDNSQSGGDSLAEAARKAREQKKEAPKPKKVYTNEDVGGPTPVPPREGAAQGTGDDQAAGGDSTDKNMSKEEATWRKRFKDARAKIALAEKQVEVLQRQLDQAQVQYYPDPQKTMEEEYTRKDINDKLTQLDAKKQEVAQLKQQLSDMEDELRKSGGDPGWARE